MLQMFSRVRMATALTLLVVLCWLGMVCPASGASRVIPMPVSIELGEGDFLLTPETWIVASGPAWIEAAKLIDALTPATGFVLRASASRPADAPTIALSLKGDVAELGEEGYRLRVTREGVTMTAPKPAGLFYAIQTFLQLMPPAIFSEIAVDDVTWKAPCVTIIDKPRFRWRGLLLDPARHFIPVPTVKRFIDIMAAHKFNRLQIHLTDNEGWRVEIRKYPTLTESGSQMDWNLRWRGGTGPRCFGFYTQDEIREIVRYAADRYITIVPEIEMPFHTGAAIVAYPELGINPGSLGALPVGQRWYKTRGLIAPRPRTVEFLQDVLTEVLELFPGEAIHIGGDEANIGHWANDPEMQAQIKRLKLKDAHELHSWFIKQMDAFLTEQGRRLVGWDEILQGGLAPGATVMSWRGEQGGIAAANAGHDVVMAPTSHTYFDYYQGSPESEPLAIGGNLPVARVYSYDPIPAEIAPDKAKHVLGVQGQLWGEYIPTAEHLDYMAYPRAAALAEVGWSAKDAKDYENFSVRLQCHLERLDAMGVNYRPLD